MIDLKSWADRAENLCKIRGWGTDWERRGVYLHLEVSELIEAIRGKHGDKVEEAGDVFFVLMSLINSNEIDTEQMMKVLDAKIKLLEDMPHES